LLQEGLLYGGMNLEETKSFFNILFSSLMDDAWNAQCMHDGHHRFAMGIMT